MMVWKDTDQYYDEVFSSIFGLISQVNHRQSLFEVQH